MNAEESVLCKIVAYWEIIEQAMKFSYLGLLTLRSGQQENEGGVQVDEN